MTQAFTVANLLRLEADALDASDAADARAQEHWTRVNPGSDPSHAQAAIDATSESIVLEHVAGTWKRIRKAYIAARWAMPVEEALTFVAEEGESALHCEKRDRELIEALRRVSNAILDTFV